MREYRKLLVGLGGDTPLGYVVRIRSETDTKRIQEMTNHEKKIRRDWQSFRAKQARTSKNSLTMTVEQFQQALKNLAGGAIR